MIPIFWSSCPMYPTPFECGLNYTDLLLTKRLWQKWLDVTSKGRLQKDSASSVGCALLPLSLDSSLWRSQLPVSLEADPIPIKPWRDCRPMDTPTAASWEILSQGCPAELYLRFLTHRNWEVIKMHYFDTLSFVINCYITLITVTM